MLKILIVDDEFYFREALKVSIPWEEIGFTICGEAKNGRDAVEKVKLLNPDILIVDINMPIMNGLELIQYLNKMGNASKVIILTGHSEFHYAKQAVEIGAHNYILKPVNEEELINALFDIKKIIEKEKKIQNEFESLKRQLKDNASLIKDSFLNELLQGNLNSGENEIINKIDYLNNSIEAEYYVAATIELYREMDKSCNNQYNQVCQYAVPSIINETLPDSFNIDICYDNDDRICLIIGANKITMDKYNFKQLLGSKLECLREAIYKQLKFTATIGVGNIKNTLFDIAESYKESLIAQKSKLTIGRNKVITYSQVLDGEVKANLFTTEHRNRLLINLRIGDEEGVGDIINEIFTQIRNKKIHHEIIFLICIEMVSVCMAFIAEIGLSVKEALDHNHLNFIEEIQSKGSIDEIERWIVEIFQGTLNIAQKDRPSRGTSMVVKVKEHIRENYHNDDLTVDEISKTLFVNYAHLCSVFKRETGTTINKYLTEYRMNKAKELFDSGNMMVLDVAERVGYADANYFGKCFKKHYGLSPSRYIENISN